MTAGWSVKNGKHRVGRQTQLQMRRATSPSNWPLISMWESNWRSAIETEIGKPLQNCRMPNEWPKQIWGCPTWGKKIKKVRRRGRGNSRRSKFSHTCGGVRINEIVDCVERQKKTFSLSPSRLDTLSHSYGHLRDRKIYNVWEEMERRRRGDLMNELQVWLRCASLSGRFEWADRWSTLQMLATIWTPAIPTMTLTSDDCQSGNRGYG